MRIAIIIMAWVVVPCPQLWGWKDNSIPKMCWEMLVSSCRTSLMCFSSWPTVPWGHCLLLVSHFYYFILFFIFIARRKIDVLALRKVYALFHQQTVIPLRRATNTSGQTQRLGCGPRRTGSLPLRGMLCCSVRTPASHQPIYIGNVCTSLAGQIQSPVLQTFLFFSMYVLLAFQYLPDQAPNL